MNLIAITHDKKTNQTYYYDTLSQKFYMKKVANKKELRGIIYPVSFLGALFTPSFVLNSMNVNMIIAIILSIIIGIIVGIIIILYSNSKVKDVGSNLDFETIPYSKEFGMKIFSTSKNTLVSNLVLATFITIFAIILTIVMLIGFVNVFLLASNSFFWMLVILFVIGANFPNRYKIIKRFKKGELQIVNE